MSQVQYRDTAKFLASEGFEGEYLEQARDLLVEQELTIDGGERIDSSKQKSVHKLLREKYERHCQRPDCQPRPHGQRELVPVRANSCDTCGGSENVRAVRQMVTAMAYAGHQKLLVVGGVPKSQNELRQICGSEIKLKIHDGQKKSKGGFLRGQRDWSDVTAIWTTGTAHAVSNVFDDADSEDFESKVLKVPGSGVAKLAKTVTAHCETASRPFEVDGTGTTVMYRLSSGVDEPAPPPSLLQRVLSSFRPSRQRRPFRTPWRERLGSISPSDAMPSSPASPDRPTAPLSRAAVGGALMGLANLVPGVSGGTMLLAAGIYPQCIEAIAKITTLRPDRSSLTLVGAVGASAAIVVLLVAGTMRDLVLLHRWMTFSVFLGATLGAVPSLWSMVGRPSAKTWIGAGVGLGAMLATLFIPVVSGAAASTSPAALFIAGLAAFSAMLLPGLSGSYLLVISGQYVPVLDAVDRLKSAVSFSAGLNWGELAAPAGVLAPFSAGTLAALIGLTSLLRMLLERQRALMLGLLLGLLVGAVLGLWPFQGEGSALVLPTPVQALGAAGLAVLGGALTYSLGRQGGSSA